MAFADGGVVAKVPLAPDAGAVNVTDAPLTGFESLSTTVATRGAANAAPTTALCPDPLVGVIDAAAPAVLVRLKLAVVDTPATDAVTVYAPAVVPAVKTAEVATPLALVVAVFTPPAKVPVAPEAGAVKVTVTPVVGDSPVVTVATSGAANAAPTAALCAVPLVTAMASTGGGGVELELLQPVRKNKFDPIKAVKMMARKLE
jgi:hypothetical protein